MSETDPESNEPAKCSPSSRSRVAARRAILSAIDLLIARALTVEQLTGPDLRAGSPRSATPRSRRQ
jgi:hypothetical protein